MANPSDIALLVQAHAEGDSSRFFEVAMRIAAAEARSGHKHVALAIKREVDKARRQVELPAPTPISKPKGELSTLLDVSYPKTRLKSMVLSPEIRSKLQRVKAEYRMMPKLLEAGLSPRRKLLLVGPPGTGKTMTAEALAGELSLPLLRVALDRLMSRYMGETAAKLRQIFDSMSSIRGVYLFDEFDAIGSERGLTNDVGEVRRILNSFLTMLERDNSTSLIVAATNHQQILDYALYRRFDEVLAYHAPDKGEVVELLCARLGVDAPKGRQLDSAVEAAIGLNFAEIDRAVDDAKKRMLIAGKPSFDMNDLIEALNERKRIYESISKRGRQLQDEDERR